MLRMAIGVLLVLLARVNTLLALSQIDSQSPCSDLQIDHRFPCQLQQANLKIARLEGILEECARSLDAKARHLQDRERLIEEMEATIERLRASLLSVKGKSLQADQRLDALEEEIRLLWDASRKNNFEIYSLELKAEEAEDRLEALNSQVQKMSDIVTEQWIQIQQFEQALQIAEMRAVKAQKQIGYASCTFLKFVSAICGKMSAFLDPYIVETGFPLSSYLSQFLQKIKIYFSTAKQYHHKLQASIKQELERDNYTAVLANEEIVFYMATALIVLPLMCLWVMLSSIIEVACNYLRSEQTEAFSP